MFERLKCRLRWLDWLVDANGTLECYKIKRRWLEWRVALNGIKSGILRLEWLVDAAERNLANGRLEHSQKDRAVA